VQAAVLGLLALLLAFTYSQAAGRFEMRQRLLVEEANAIGTVRLRADFLPEPARSQFRQALREYTAGRVAREEARLDVAALQQQIRASEDLQGRMWSTVTGSLQGRAPTPLDALLLGELNHLIDLHTTRWAAYEYRVPAAVLLLLGLVSLLAMALMGLSFGQADRGGLLLLVVLATIIAAVALLILDLDHSHRGWTRLSQTSLEQLARAATPMAPASPSPLQSP
jgi:hypothetical protein